MEEERQQSAEKAKGSVCVCVFYGSEVFVFVLVEGWSVQGVC